MTEKLNIFLLQFILWFYQAAGEVSMIREKLIQQFIINLFDRIYLSRLFSSILPIQKYSVANLLSSDDDGERNGKNYVAQCAQEHENNLGDINGYLVKALTANQSSIGISPTFVHRCSACSEPWKTIKGESRVVQFWFPSTTHCTPSRKYFVDSETGNASKTI